MGDPFRLRALLGEEAGLCHRALTAEHGVSLPPFIDHHVHLHLFDESGLAAHGIAGIVDLGGDPVALARREDHGIPRVAYAGAFLTTAGGYPAGREWAPAEIVREIGDASPHPGVAGGAATAVDEQASFGASVIKVVLNSVAGPVLDARTLAAIVANAVTSGRCGRCQAARAAERPELERLAALGPLFAAPAMQPPPIGACELLAWRAQWIR